MLLPKVWLCSNIELVVSVNAVRIPLLVFVHFKANIIKLLQNFVFSVLTSSYSVWCLNTCISSEFAKPMNPYVTAGGKYSSICIHFHGHLSLSRSLIQANDIRDRLFMSFAVVEQVGPKP